MKPETLTDKVRHNNAIASVVAIKSTTRKAVFISDHVEPIIKISVMAHKEGLSYEILHQTNGMLRLEATYRPINVCAKHDLAQTFHGVIRDTDA